MRIKYKESRGITMVALIVTIIILLILAVVAIEILKEGGILKKTKQAALQSKLKEIEELGQISLMDRKIEEVTRRRRSNTSRSH